MLLQDVLNKSISCSFTDKLSKYQSLEKGKREVNCNKQKLNIIYSFKLDNHMSLNNKCKISLDCYCIAFLRYQSLHTMALAQLENTIS